VQIHAASYSTNTTRVFRYIYVHVNSYVCDCESALGGEKTLATVSQNLVSFL